MCINFKKYKLPIFLLMQVCIGFFSIVHAQQTLKEIPSYPFLQPTLNHISYPDSLLTLDHFYKKMDTVIKTGKGKLNIVHIGGSHIQADIYSHQLRKNLIHFHPNLVGARGFVFPFSIAETNNPSNYKTHYTGKWVTSKNTQATLSSPLGLSGITVSTNDSIASISIEIPTKEDYLSSFNSIRIIGKNNLYQLQVTTPNDTITQMEYDDNSASFLIQLSEKTNQFTLQLSSNDTLRTFDLQGIVLENELSGLRYHAIGVNGASTTSYLKCEQLERDLATLQPDLVILSIGINDAAGDNFDPEFFKKNYVKLFQRIKTVAPNTSILFTTNNDSYRKKGKKYQNNPNGEVVKKVMFELATSEHAAVWDLFTIMGGLESMKLWENQGLSQKDKIHFKAEGYQLIGDMLYNALIYDYLTKYY